MQHIERSLSSCKFDTIPTLRSETVKRSFLYMFCLQPFKVKPLEPLDLFSISLFSTHARKLKDLEIASHEVRISMYNGGQRRENNISQAKVVDVQRHRTDACGNLKR